MGILKVLGLVALSSAVLVATACAVVKKEKKAEVDEKSALPENLTIVMDKKDYEVE